MTAMGSFTIDPLGHAPSLKQRVYEAIQDLIIRGVLQPGQHLRETDLARQLGVSRGPVREALHLLERDGWVDLRPRFGAFVHNPSSREVDEFFDVKILLEAETARLAAMNATERAVGELDDLLAAADRAMAESDERALMEASALFHRGIATLSGNRVLCDIVDRLDKEIRLYFMLMSGMRSEEAWTEHRTLVEAIKRSDPLTAAVTMRDHTEKNRIAYHERRSRFNGDGDQGSLLKTSTSGSGKQA